MDEFPRQGRLAGIDFGHVRIGVAVSDPSQKFASPHENYTRRDDNLDRQFFRKLAKEHEIVGFIVGLPIHTSGEESKKSIEARQFAAWLTHTTSLPVRFHDERYTSVEAEQILNEAQLTKKKRKQRLDMLAAQLILAGYLESDREDTPMEPLADD